MEIRILRDHEIAALLSMKDCIDLMGRTMATVSAGDTALPMRSVLRMPGDIGMFGMMPGYVGGAAGSFGIKLASLFPRNAGTGYSAHLGLVLLFETGHGLPVAILDGSQITALRTAATSALATRLLARPDAGDLAILGAGKQAEMHLEAMLAVRSIRRVRLWARSAAKAQAFAQTFSARYGVHIEAMPSVREAVADADLICTVTHAKDPILQGEWVSDGAHLNVVGSGVPSDAEIDTALLVRAQLFIDYRPATLAQAGEYLRAVQAGAITEEHIRAEIGEVESGKKPGRRSPQDITLYKSLGVAAQDLAAARQTFDNASAQGVGQVVQF